MDTKVTGSCRRVVALRSREEMLKRLLVVNDNNHAREHLYPLLLENANRELVAQGIVMMLVTTIFDYTEDIKPIRNLLLMMAPDYIDAVVDDEEVATEAKAFLAECRAASA